MKAAFALFLVSLSTPALGQSFAFDRNLSKIEFNAKNFGVRVAGELHGVDGKFNLDESNITASHFYASVNVATIDTGIGLRDKHLKQKNYFDAQRFPKITMASKRITESGGVLSALVSITIRDVTRDAVINLTIEKKDDYTVFTAQFTINRLHYGVGEPSFSLSDEVIVSLRVIGVAAPR